MINTKWIEVSFLPCVFMLSLLAMFKLFNLLPFIPWKGLLIPLGLLYLFFIILLIVCVLADKYKMKSENNV